jgi:hypothetical protein
VTANCDDYPYEPYIVTGETDTRCHQFQAVATTVNFNVIINSTCTAGNVTAFSWTLQSNTCGAILQSGDITDLAFESLTIGNFYTFCYTYTVPSAFPFSCYHTTHYPFFVGAATVDLPLELKTFNGVKMKNDNLLVWETISERDNDYFTLERMNGENNWEFITQVKGAGNSTEEKYYEFIDINRNNEIDYYRLSQTDFNGVTQNLKTIIVNNILESNYKLYNLIGQEVDENYTGLIIVKYDNNEVIKIYK